jgi:hypothetical protein
MKKSFALRNPLFIAFQTISTKAEGSIETLISVHDPKHTGGNPQRQVNLASERRQKAKIAPARK